MTKRAAVVNDLSSFGRCSLTAYIAVLSAMGVQTCPLPTAVLSAQSEFERHFCRDLTEDIPRYIQSWSENRERFDCICTGYFAGGKQPGYALELIDKFRKGCTVLVDPVMGDDGKLYPAYDGEARKKMKRLVDAADIITPNLTELCLLADEDYFSLISKSSDVSCLEAVEKIAKRFSKNRGVIVTGIQIGDEICNLAVQNEDTKLIRRRKIGERFSGTGDLFSAAVCGCIMNGKSIWEAAETAADFISASVADTINEPHDPLYGVNFEKNLHKLTEVK